MNQTYISLELAIANNDLDLFFQKILHIKYVTIKNT